MSMLESQTGGVVPLCRHDLLNIVQHFCEAGSQDRFTPAKGLEALHDAVNTAFARVDVQESQREQVNIFINALQDLYETVDEQDQSSDVFMVEGEDLVDISMNLDCLRQVICIQHADLHHHDISSALLWAKTALKKLISNGWNLSAATV